MTCMTWLGTTRIMLSVGKDRTLFLWRLRPNRSFELFTSLPKAHSRVIWACAPVFLHSRVLKVDGTSQEMAVFVTVVPSRHTKLPKKPFVSRKERLKNST